MSQWERSNTRHMEDTMLDVEPRPKMTAPEYPINQQNLLDDPVEKPVLVFVVEVCFRFKKIVTFLKKF